MESVREDNKYTVFSELVKYFNDYRAEVMQERAGLYKMKHWDKFPKEWQTLNGRLETIDLNICEIMRELKISSHCFDENTSRGEL